MRGPLSLSFSRRRWGAAEPGQVSSAGHEVASTLVLTVRTAAAYACFATPRFWHDPVPSAYLAASLVLALSLALLSAIDIRTFTLPDTLTYPLLVAGLVFCAMFQLDSLSIHFIAAALGYLSFSALAVGYEIVRQRPGLGMGDAKLLAVSGAWLGIAELPPVVLIASLTALLVVLAQSISGRTITAETRIPFGPCLAFGTWLVWLYGVPL